MFLFIILSTLISSWMLSIQALPIQNKMMQVTFFQEQTKLYELAKEDEWFMSQEYDIFSSITDYYENIVDTTLCSNSEDLLLNLIHLTKESKNTVLKSQAQLFGIDVLTGKKKIHYCINIQLTPFFFFGNR